MEQRSDDANILRFSRQDDGRVVRLIGDGEIDAYSVSVLRSIAEEALNSRAERIEVDLALVTFIDSSGLRALADAHTTARARGTPLTIVELSAPVRRILEISGMLGELTGGSGIP